MGNNGTKTFSAAVSVLVDVKTGGNTSVESHCRMSLVDMGNANASIVYLQCFNRPAAAVALGTDRPLLSFFVPASGGRVVPLPEMAILGGDGFSIAATTLRGNAVAPGVPLDVNIIL